MIWRTEPGRTCWRRSAPTGFTLLEIMIVLAVLGLAAALILYRGPPRSPALDLRASAYGVVRALRLARAEAISSNRRISVKFDLQRRDIVVGDAAPLVLPPALALAVVGTGTPREEKVSIDFEPDGSSSGGHVDLSEGERIRRIGIDWLTGRVGITTP